eukprot:maker-scaffold_12-snap-gene-10.54-mRNA-1 protein AED:0.24 eAED:0.24 QI:92/1/1/1/1/1/4/103/745
MGVAKQINRVLSRNFSGINTNIRNIGIIAHIDAGKTTTTERLLHETGFIPSVGEVHDGDTVTDFLPLERERGITVNAACTTMYWAKDDVEYQINSIDTPGHVDFSVEVERSLMALDNALLILDGTKGVQPQTLKVAQQAKKRNIPFMVYVNKMDRVGADFEKAVVSVDEKLNLAPIPIQYPAFSSDLVDNDGHESTFIGIYDLINFELLDYRNAASKGKEYERINVETSVSDDICNTLRSYHEAMCEKLSMYDDNFADLFLLSEDSCLIDKLEIKKSLKKICQHSENMVAPVILGSSYKNIGIPQVLDNSVELFRPYSENIVDVEVGAGFLGLVFKVQHDENRGQLTFIKVLKGELPPSGVPQFYCKEESNLLALRKERYIQVLRVNADHYSILKQGVSPGEIVALVGLKHARTGEFLSSDQKLSSVKNADIKVPELEVPRSVFSACFDAKTPSNNRRLMAALETLEKDDPSLSYFVDDETEQIVVSGLGELHLEVVLYKLRHEFRLPEAQLKDLQVRYRETISEPFEMEFTILTKKTSVLQDVDDDLETQETVDIKLRFSAKEDINSSASFKAVLTGVSKSFLHHIETAGNNALQEGPLSSSPFMGVSVRLEFVGSNQGPVSKVVGSLNESQVKDLIRRTFNKLWRLVLEEDRSKFELLEPFGTLSVTVPSEYTGDVVNELAKNSQTVEFVSVHGTEDQNTEATGEIEAIVRISEMLGYATRLRKLTKGAGVFALSFLKYSNTT